MARWFLLSSVLLFLLAGMTGSSGCILDDEQRVGGRGTVRYIGLEGGFYGIVADDSSQYFPLNLPAQFKQDSLRVEFKGVIKDTPTIYMWGRTIELSFIRKYGYY